MLESTVMKKATDASNILNLGIIKLKIERFKMIQYRYHCIVNLDGDAWAQCAVAKITFIGEHFAKKGAFTQKRGTS